MAPAEHRALVFEAKATPPTIKTLPTPKPAKGEVLIKVHSAALNPVDAFNAQTGMLIKNWPTLLGYDGSGVVEEVGEGVTTFAKGDRVIGKGHFDGQNMLQEYTTILARVTSKLPDNVTFEGGSTIPLCLGTAAIGLYSRIKKPHGGAGLTPPWEEGGRNKYLNQPIMIVGGSSNVGQFAIQLAKISGFNPIITTSSEHNIDYCKRAGATHVIDYKKTPYGQAFSEAVTAITTEPIKIIYDTAMSEETQTAAWSILAPGGKLIIARPVGLSKNIPEPNVDDKDGKRVVTVFGSIHSDEVGGDVALGASLFKALEELLRAGDIKPSAVEILPGGLNGVTLGFKKLLENKVSGKKLVARIGDTEW